MYVCRYVCMYVGTSAEDETKATAVRQWNGNVKRGGVRGVDRFPFHSYVFSHVAVRRSVSFRFLFLDLLTLSVSSVSFALPAGYDGKRRKEGEGGALP